MRRACRSSLILSNTGRDLRNFSSSFAALSNSFLFGAPFFEPSEPFGFGLNLCFPFCPPTDLTLPAWFDAPVFSVPFCVMLCFFSQAPLAERVGVFELIEAPFTPAPEIVDNLFLFEFDFGLPSLRRFVPFTLPFGVSESASFGDSN